ncbi:hypothetical protein N7540_004128 [Penicillium herquei]|nr:hypothetical protein N7540_004128 [Penicillium herquei]
MRVLYYTFVCLFGTTLAMPVQNQRAQALSERQDAAAAAGSAGDGVASGLQAVAGVGQDIASGVGKALSARQSDSSGGDASGSDTDLLGDTNEEIEALLEDT